MSMDHDVRGGVKSRGGRKITKSDVAGEDLHKEDVVRDKWMRLISSNQAYIDDS